MLLNNQRPSIPTKGPDIPTLNGWYVHRIALKCKTGKEVVILVGFVNRIKVPIFKIVQVGIEDKIIIDDHGNAFILGNPDPKYESAFPNARESFFQNKRWLAFE